jgi:hypothetical protein
MTKKLPDPVHAYLSRIGKKGGQISGKSKSAKKLAALAANRATGRPKGAKDTQPRKKRAGATGVQKKPVRPAPSR